MKKYLNLTCAILLAGCTNSIVEKPKYNVVQMEEVPRKIIKDDKPVIVTKITSDGYVIKHGNHYHFIKGKVPENAILKIENALNASDDGYIFNVNDIVGEDNDGYIVKHGNHYHYIYKSKKRIEKKEEKSFVIPINNELHQKIKHIAESLRIDINQIKITKINGREAIVYPHEDHHDVAFLDEIDTSKVYKPHHEEKKDKTKSPILVGTGIEILKKLGFSDDVIPEIVNTNTEQVFPKNETDENNIKKWLNSIKMLDLQKIKDPLNKLNLNLLPNIESLGLGYTKINDITPIFKLKKLKGLYIPKTGIKNYDFLKKLPNLETLDFSQNDINDISFLKNVPNLKVVAGVGNSIQDISPIEELKKLEGINLDYNSIENITALSKLPQLKMVSLEYNKLTNVGSLNANKHLTTLYLSNNPYLEISTLSSTSLNDLKIKNSNIYDLSFLKKLPNLEALDVDHNKIRTLKFVGDSTKLEVLSASYNNISTLDGIEYAKNLNKLILNHNQVTSLQIPSESNIAHLELQNNNLESLNGVNNFIRLEELNVNNNFISSFKLDKPNSTLQYLYIKNNNLSQEELKVNEFGIPSKLLENFTNIQGGDLSENFALTKENIIAKIEKMVTLIPEENKKVKEIALLLEELRILKLDVQYSTNYSKDKLIHFVKELSKIQEQYEVLKSQPTHSFEFKVEDIISGNEEGYLIKHEDHTHFVYKTDLTDQQIEEAEAFLKNKGKSSDLKTVDHTITEKLDYIALFYGIDKKQIHINNNKFIFNYKGIKKEIVHTTISVPKMSDDLELDFEQELLSIAKAMHIDVDSIKIEDGTLTVPHGDHTHEYTAKSPGWRLYIQNKMPNLEIITLQGELDSSIVHAEITNLENKARLLLKNQPRKLKQALSWLKNVREVALPWSVTSTKGYMQTFKKFEELYFNEKVNEEKKPTEITLSNSQYDLLRAEIRKLDEKKYLKEKVELLNQLDEIESKNNLELLIEIKEKLKNINQLKSANPLIEKYKELLFYLESNVNQDFISETLKKEITTLLTQANTLNKEDEKINIINSLEKMKEKIKQDRLQFEQKDMEYSKKITNILYELNKVVKDLEEDDLKQYFLNKLNEYQEKFKTNSIKSNLLQEILLLEKEIKDTISTEESTESISLEISTIINYINANRRNIKDTNLKWKVELLNRFSNLEDSFKAQSAPLPDILKQLQIIQKEVSENLDENSSSAGNSDFGW